MSSGFSKLFMRPSQLKPEEQQFLADKFGGKVIRVIRKGEKTVTAAPFNTIKVGDTFFVNGKAVKCGESAQHYNGPNYQGSIVFDVSGHVWYPNDVDTSNLKEVEVVHE